MKPRRHALGPAWRWAPESVGLVLVVLLMLAGLRTPLNVYDEGNILVSAQRLLDGEVPYRDFWGVYPPGELLAVAGVMALTGVDVQGPRLLDVLVRIATVLLAYVLVRRIGGRREALVAALAFAVALAAVGRHYLYPVQPALLLALAAFLLWHEAMRGARPLRSTAAVSGVLLGASAFFRWDIAGYAVVGLVVAGGLAAVGRGDGARAARRILLLGGSSSALTALVLYGTTTAFSGVRPLLEQVFVFPLTGLHDARQLPVPAPWQASLDPTSAWAQLYLVVGVLLVLVGIVVVVVVRTGNRLSTRGYALVGLTCFAVAALAQGLSRTDRSHLLPSLLIGVLALAVATSDRKELSRSIGRLTRALPVVLAVASIAVVAIGLRMVVRDLDRFPPTRCWSAVTQSSCVWLSPDQERALAFVIRSSPPAEPILVANAQNSRINVNDTSFYFLADRRPATPYAELHPGVADTSAVQETMVRDLERQSVRWVVLVTMPDSHEPNLSSYGRGVTVLDDYVSLHYVTRFSDGAYRVLERSAIPASG